MSKNVEIVEINVFRVQNALIARIQYALPSNGIVEFGCEAVSCVNLPKTVRLSCNFKKSDEKGPVFGGGTWLLFAGENFQEIETILYVGRNGKNLNVEFLQTQLTLQMFLLNSIPEGFFAVSLGLL